MRLVARIIGLLSAMIVGAALPLAIQTWLAGGHATPDQGRLHTLAIASHGIHVHSAVNDGDAGRRESAPEPITVVAVGAGSTVIASAHAHAPGAESWLAVLALLLLATVAGGQRRRWPPDQRHAAGTSHGVPHPPPRFLLTGPA